MVGGWLEEGDGGNVVIDERIGGAGGGVGGHLALIDVLVEAEAGGVGAGVVAVENGERDAEDLADRINGELDGILIPSGRHGNLGKGCDGKRRAGGEDAALGKAFRIV